MTSTIALHTVKQSINPQLTSVLVLGASHQIGISLSHLLLRANVRVTGSARSAAHNRQLWELSDDFPLDFAPLSLDLVTPQAKLPTADALVVVIPRSLALNVDSLADFTRVFPGIKICIHPHAHGQFFSSPAALKVNWQQWRTFSYPDDLPERPARDLFAVVDRVFLSLFSII
jgi:NAD(P)-dependent dehydrogenase (short-subunit alcohol dehydrogenase family)